MANRSLAESASRVSLEDCPASSEDLIALRDWMQSDAIPDDECPTLDDTAYAPSREDESWWAEQTRDGVVKLLRHVHASPALALAITETEPHGEDFRYAVRSYSGGFQVAVEGFDCLADAEAYLRHLTSPLPLREGGAQW